ncbi:hypothetical protein, variant, partial [Sphaeroforma arctica JP610]
AIPPSAPFNPIDLTADSDDDERREEACALSTAPLATKRPSRSLGLAKPSKFKRRRNGSITSYFNVVCPKPPETPIKELKHAGSTMNSEKAPPVVDVRASGSGAIVLPAAVQLDLHRSQPSETELKGKQPKLYDAHKGADVDKHSVRDSDTEQTASICPSSMPSKPETSVRWEMATNKKTNLSDSMPVPQTASTGHSSIPPKPETSVRCEMATNKKTSLSDFMPVLHAASIGQSSIPAKAKAKRSVRREKAPQQKTSLNDCMHVAQKVVLGQNSLPSKLKASVKCTQTTNAKTARGAFKPVRSAHNHAAQRDSDQRQFSFGGSAWGQQCRSNGPPPSLAQTMRENIKLPTLNTQQMAAVQTPFDKATLIVAGAGTGKTRVITTRILAMIKSGIAPSSILAVSFTNKAVYEMRERLAAAIPAPYAGAVNICTLHGLCYSMVMCHYSALHYQKKPGLLLDYQKRKLVTSVLIQIEDSHQKKALTSLLKLQTHKDHSWAQLLELAETFLDKKLNALVQEFCNLKPSKNVEDISIEANYLLHHYVLECCKNKLMPFRDRKKFAVPSAETVKKATKLWNFAKQNDYTAADYLDDNRLMLARTTAECLENNLVDFFDLLLCARKLLTDEVDVKRKYLDNFTHILVDEFQDLNSIQYDILKMLSTNVTAVGDDDQSIFGFTGADSDLIFEDFRLTSGLAALSDNYRCSGNILRFATQCPKGINGRVEKTLRTTKADGAPVRVVNVPSSISQAEYIANEVEEYHKTHPHVSLSEIAVLTRIWKGRLNPHVRLVEAVGVADVKLMALHLRFVLDSSDDFACLEALAACHGIGERAIEKVKNIHQALKASCVFDTLNHIMLTGRVERKTLNIIEQFLATYEMWCTSSIHLDLCSLLKLVYDTSNLKQLKKRKHERKQAERDLDNTPNTSTHKTKQTPRLESSYDSTSDEDSDEDVEGAATDTYSNPQFIRNLTEEARYFLTKRGAILNKEGRPVPVPADPSWTKDPPDSLREMCRRVIVQEVNARPEFAKQCIATLDQVILGEIYERHHVGPVILSEFLSSVGLGDTGEAKGQEEEADKGMVTISTIHKAKGLEWNVVFVVFWNDGILPMAYEDRDRNLRPPTVPQQSPLNTPKSTSKSDQKSGPKSKHKINTPAENGAPGHTSGTSGSTEERHHRLRASIKKVRDQEAIEAKHLDEEMKMAHVACTRPRDHLHVISVGVLNDGALPMLACPFVDYDKMPPGSIDRITYESKNDFRRPREHRWYEEDPGRFEEIGSYRHSRFRSAHSSASHLNLRRQGAQANRSRDLDQRFPDFQTAARMYGW